MHGRTKRSRASISNLATGQALLINVDAGSIRSVQMESSDLQRDVWVQVDCLKN